MPEGCTHNGHLYYLLLPDLPARTAVIERLAEANVNAVFHFVPLHASPAGQRFGRASGPLPLTEAASERILRLPLWAGMSGAQIDQVITATATAVTAVECEPTLPRFGG